MESRRSDSAPGEGRRRDRTRGVRGASAMGAALAATVAFSALAIGTVHRVTLLLVAIGAVVTAHLAARRLDSSASSRGVVLPALGALVLAGLTALQALPLPVSSLAAVAPPNADVWSRALLPFGEPVGWGTLSLDPGASLTDALELCVYAAVMLAAATLAANRPTRAWPIGIVFASAIAVALVTIAHDLAGASRVFGVYAPRTAVESHHLGPFLNPNNLAGYLVLGVFSGIGLVLMRDAPIPGWASGIGVAVLVAAAVRSASRGGVAVLPIGFLVVGVLVVWARYRHGIGAGGRPLLVLGAGVGAGALFAIVGGTFGIWRELLQDDLSKLRFASWTMPLISDHRWLGIGRGAFESAFVAYRIAPHSNTIFTHPENFPIQWIAEWGLPVGCAALLALAWVLRPWAVGATRSGLAAGAWAGVVMLLVQNLADLGIEIAGVGIATSTLVGALWGMRRGDRTAPARTPSPRAVAIAITAGAVVLGAAMLRAGLSDVRADRDALHDAWEALKKDDVDGRRALMARIRTAMLRHPADYWFPLLGGTIAWRSDDPNAMAWIQRALERAPLSGRTHLLLAEVLADRRAKAQALFELRLAAEYERPLVSHTGALAARWATSFEDLMRAVPDGPAGADVLDVAAARSLDPDIRRRADREAIVRDPARLGPRSRLIDAALLTLQGQEPGPCGDRGACEREVIAHADAIQASAPESSMGAQVRARLLVVQGRLGDAAALLEPACALPKARASCLQLRATVLSNAGRGEELEPVLKAYVAESCATTAGCAEAHTWIAHLRTERRELSLAVASLRRAAVQDPTDARWLRVADAAERANQPATVVEALERVAERNPTDTALRKRLDEARRTNVGRYITP